MIHLGKQNILGIRVDAIDYESAATQIVEAGRSRRPMAVSALAVHGLMSGFLDPRLKYRLNRFDLICPDGQPVRWALNWLGKAGLKDRVYGPFLTLHVCQMASENGVSLFLFGSSSDVLDRLEANLKAKFPALKIAGRQPSRFRKASPAEVEEDVQVIRESGAGIVLAGLGCPRQEIWAFEMRGRLSLPVLAVGAAFDFHAGSLKMAPSWMQNSGLEWLFRLWIEPKRLWRRYVVLNPLYVANLIGQRLGIIRFDPEQSIAPVTPERFG